MYTLSLSLRREVGFHNSSDPGLVESSPNHRIETNYKLTDCLPSIVYSGTSAWYSIPTRMPGSIGDNEIECIKIINVW